MFRSGSNRAAFPLTFFAGIILRANYSSISSLTTRGKVKIVSYLTDFCCCNRSRRMHVIIHTTWRMSTIIYNFSRSSDKKKQCMLFFCEYLVLGSYNYYLRVRECVRRFKRVHILSSCPLVLVDILGTIYELKNSGGN